MMSGPLSIWTKLTKGYSLSYRKGEHSPGPIVAQPQLTGPPPGRSSRDKVLCLFCPLGAMPHGGPTRKPQICRTMPPRVPLLAFSVYVRPPPPQIVGTQALRDHDTRVRRIFDEEPLVRAGGYGITSRGPMRFSGNDVGPPEHMD